ncbi:MAG TPA: hypothetical protein VJY36_06045 [Candidatus Bathyarchaeia archaeon]|nr:hypothetical protein [Candidatus Bathyarchaeia archaeon]
MPRKGYKCITVTDKVHEDIKKRAEETNRTMRGYVEYLLAKDKVVKEGNNCAH